MNKIFWPDKPTFNPDLCINLEVGQGDSVKIRKQALKEGYREQDKRHVTLLSDSKIEEILKYTSLSKDEVSKKILQIANNYDWRYKELDIYHIEKVGSEDRPEVKEHRQSYVRAINMPDMGKFYKELDETFGTKLLVQFPHITLFTKGEKENLIYYGISISSEEVFKKLKPIKII
ncbi:MAG: hypothetical protein M1324_04090 [Patescibacteria group bacterium]|nr:hypothetical protein [Patescibacteria group bacterium]